MQDSLFTRIQTHSKYRLPSKPNLADGGLRENTIHIFFLKKHQRFLIVQELVDGEHDGAETH